MDGLRWNVDFRDQARRKYHEKKVASKKLRGDLLLHKLGVVDSEVHRIVLECPGVMSSLARPGASLEKTGNANSILHILPLAREEGISAIQDRPHVHKFNEWLTEK
mmetsp:Transcript_1006/g.2147  ORF Transcript_1006/g.2147 Transcript_1006/m.2147 type:complete len:106 (+) Transcript_1006:194-511(+)